MTGHVHTDLTVVEGLGRARACEGLPDSMSRGSNHEPVPVRYVWHHVLPQTCGGKTEVGNLVSLCDNCHYATHSLLYLLAKAGGSARKIKDWGNLGTPKLRELAHEGYALALTAGTVDKIPDEGMSQQAT